MISSEKKQLYLFNWKKFYKEKSYDKFPPQLCFPEYFAYSILTVLNSYYNLLMLSINEEEEEELKRKRRRRILRMCFRFFATLQDTIDLLFGKNSEICLKDTFTIHKTISKFVEDYHKQRIKKDDANNPKNMIYLETFLNGEQSKQNYQKLLFQQSLRYYKVRDVNEFYRYLLECQCCEKLDEEEEEKIICNSNSNSSSSSYVHSKHYVSSSSNNNCSKELNKIRGPPKWGPYFWNIFHALADKGEKRYYSDECDEGERKNIVAFLNAYPTILQFIIPCSMCRDHYNSFVKPNDIPPCEDVKKFKDVYNTIHSIVTVYNNNSNKNLKNI